MGLHDECDHGVTSSTEPASIVCRMAIKRLHGLVPGHFGLIQGFPTSKDGSNQYGDLTRTARNLAYQEINRVRRLMGDLPRTVLLSKPVADVGQTAPYDWGRRT